MTGPNPSGLCMCGCGQATSIATKSNTRTAAIKGQPVRYLYNHSKRSAPVDYVVNPVTGCWDWQLHISRRTGYGQSATPSGRKTTAHRAVYERLVGPIPDGLQLDHLCRNRGCVNPDHLEPVTLKENNLRGVGLAAVNARKTACHRGHPFNERNTYVTPDGRRHCRVCARAHSQRHRERTARLDVAA